jgi:hypothetical protein
MVREFKTKFEKYELYEMEGDYQGKLVGKSEKKETLERVKSNFEKLYPNREYKIFTFVR